MLYTMLHATLNATINTTPHILHLRLLVLMPILLSMQHSMSLSVLCARSTPPAHFLTRVESISSGFDHGTNEGVKVAGSTLLSMPPSMPPSIFRQTPWRINQGINQESVVGINGGVILGLILASTVESPGKSRLAIQSLLLSLPQVAMALWACPKFHT